MPKCGKLWFQGVLPEGTKHPSFVHRKISWDYKDIWVDPTVEEVRKIREAHAAKFNYDSHAIYQDLKDREKQGGWKLESRPPKRPLRAI